VSAPHASGEPRPATAAWRFASGLFFLAALAVGGGALGVAVTCGLGLLGAVQFGLMRW
jgi:hypothetical protein